MVNVRLLKSWEPLIAAISGVIRSATSAVTTAPNAAPITMPTARSTTLPRRRNSLKSVRALTRRRLRRRSLACSTASSLGVWGILPRYDGPRERAQGSDAVRDRRGGDRGHPAGPVRRRRRRGRSRERGRPDDRGAVRDPRGDQLHGDPRPGPHLPLPDRGALRRARPQADDGAERDAVRNGVHGLDRGAGGDLDRDLGARPVADDPGRDRPVEGPAGPRPARPCLPAPRAAGRRAPARGPDRGGGRSR